MSIGIIRPLVVIGLKKDALTLIWFLTILYQVSILFRQFPSLKGRSPGTQVPHTLQGLEALSFIAKRIPVCSLHNLGNLKEYLTNEYISSSIYHINLFAGYHLINQSNRARSQRYCEKRIVPNKLSFFSA